MSTSRRSSRLRNKPSLANRLEAYAKKKFGNEEVTYTQAEYEFHQNNTLQKQPTVTKPVAKPTREICVRGRERTASLKTTQSDDAATDDNDNDEVISSVVTTSTGNNQSSTTEVKETRIRDGNQTIVKSIKTITTLTIVSDGDMDIVDKEVEPSVVEDEDPQTSPNKGNEKETDEENLLITGLNNGQIVIAKKDKQEGIPRSKFNRKFVEVYKAGPKLRNVSPPRFTTFRVPKQKIDFSKMGVKKLEKVKGNPYSKFSTRRNLLVYGNKDIPEDEQDRYDKLDEELKNVIAQQTGGTPKNSYVDNAVLKNVKKKLGINTKKNAAAADEEILDIESIDETNQPDVKSRRTCKTVRKYRANNGSTTLQCDMCGYKTTHSGHMKVHVTSVHQQLRKYKCQYPDCDYKASRKGSMVRHEKCVHRKNVLYKCPRENCNFESAWTKSLERHVITVHEQLRPWECEFCDFSAGQKYTLQLHIASIHKGTKNIICSFCDFRSNTRRVVKHHIERKHADKIKESINGKQTTNQQ